MFFVEGIRRWLVINLVTLIYTYSYFILLHIAAGYRRLRSFQQTRYQVSIAELLIQNVWSQVAESVRRPRTTLKILYFSAATNFFEYHVG